MLAILTGLWTKAQGWVMAIGAALAAVAGIYLAGRRSGKSDEQTAGLKQTLADRKVADDVQQKVDSMDDDSVRNAARRRMRESNDK